MLSFNSYGLFEKTVCVKTDAKERNNFFGNSHDIFYESDIYVSNCTINSTLRQFNFKMS
jgi:hypothetical protein